MVHLLKLAERWARVGVSGEAQGAEVRRGKQKGEQSGGSLTTDWSEQSGFPSFENLNPKYLTITL
jgi:hypothetical protein